MPDRSPRRGHHARRRVLLGRTSLVRRSDRLQALSRLLAGLAVALSLPVAVLVGLTVHGDAAAAAAQQRAERSPVTATLVADTGRSRPVPGAGDAGADAAPPATRAVWHMPDGLHQGLVDAPAGSRAGTVIGIWVDRRGAVTAPPMGDGDVAAETLAAAVLVICLMGGLAVLGHLGLVGVLDRSRMRRWDREWAMTEPEWTSHSH